MFIKQFRSAWARVPDPLRPGKRALEERLVPTGATAISHGDQHYEAGEDGWFDVPNDVGLHLLGFRHPGSERFYQPHDVGEDVRTQMPAGSAQIDPAEVAAMQARIAELEAEAKAKAEADAKAAKAEADAKAKAAAATKAK